MSAKEVSRKVNATKNYRLFARNEDNRVLDIKKHRKLEQSMKQYGFLPCFPIVAVRDENKNLIVKDGQHRLAIAETLDIPVYWIEETIDFDVAVVNSTSRTWVLRDYAQKYANNGNKAYQEGIEFADDNRLPLGTAFALLGGCCGFTNIQADYVSGKFKIKDRSWADAVAAVYVALTSLAPAMHNARFIEACMAVCRVPTFDRKRLLQNVDRCREKLVPYSTRDAYLDMLEELYNFGRSKLTGLKAEATMAMRERNAAHKSRAAKQAKKQIAAA